MDNYTHKEVERIVDEYIIKFTMWFTGCNRLKAIEMKNEFLEKHNSVLYEVEDVEDMDDNSTA